MALQYLTDIDLNKNELQNAVIQALAGDPAVANLKAGQIWFNSADHYLKYFDGTNIIPLFLMTVDSALSSTSTNPVQNKAINTALGNKVDKVSGKGLSTNDYTTAEKNKLGGIEAGAEVNQNAYSIVSPISNGTTQEGWSFSSGSVHADAKTAELLLMAGANISIVKAANSQEGIEALRIAATDTTYSAGTDALLTAGTDTANRVWQPKILHDYIATVVGAVDAMRFKGTLGTGGTITALPTSGVRVGDTYMVITAGTYAGQVCEVGDLIIATATTPTWTVAQTNINGAITSISSATGSPITVSGSGASRTIGIGYTAVTGQPTRNPSLSFGESFTISQISQSTTGQITATDRTITIPSTRADSSHDGLMSSTDKAKLDSLAGGTVIAQNPALTPSSGVCTWTITALNGMVAGTVQVFEKATGKQVMCEVAWLPVVGQHQEGDPNNYIRIKILSSANIAADTYRAIVVGF